jgi:hypothetical protein
MYVPPQPTIGPGNISVSRCQELATRERLDVSEWIELTGIGEQKFGMYVVSCEGVRFKGWSENSIQTSDAESQMQMRRDNKSLNLKFPCSPAQLLHFVDNADLGGKHFEVPTEFRDAVGQRTLPKDDKQAPPRAYDPDLYGWKHKAREIGKRLASSHKKLSLDQIADMVRKEMSERHNGGERSMTGRGNRIPAASSIKRHALNGIKS